jgi:hypothetical protein
MLRRLVPLLCPTARRGVRRVINPSFNISRYPTNTQKVSVQSLLAYGQDCCLAIASNSPSYRVHLLAILDVHCQPTVYTRTQDDAEDSTCYRTCSQMVNALVLLGVPCNNLASWLDRQPMFLTHRIMVSGIS